jgi:hypothetical protein
MSNSDSTHFSDKLSYKILCISNYQSKDMNYARFTQILPFSRKTEKGCELFLTQTKLATELTTGPGGG